MQLARAIISEPGKDAKENFEQKLVPKIGSSSRQLARREACSSWVSSRSGWARSRALDRTSAASTSGIPPNAISSATEGEEEKPPLASGFDPVKRRPP